MCRRCYGGATIRWGAGAEEVRSGGGDAEDDDSAVGAACDDCVGATRELQLTDESRVALKKC